MSMKAQTASRAAIPIWPFLRRQAGSSSLGRRDNEFDIVILDGTGELSGLTAKSASSSERSSRICLQLRPGMSLLRRLSTTSLEAKEIEPALELWAEESLPEPCESYYLDHWVISPHVRGLAAVPRLPLQRARQALLEAGFNLAALRVPELCPPVNPATSIVIWKTDHGILVCVWSNQVLLDWQAFVLKLSARAVVEQVAASCPEPPVSIHLDDELQHSDIRSELATTWPGAPIVRLRYHDRHTANGQLGTGLTFESYVKEERQLRATREDKRKLALALAAVVMAGFFLLFASVTRLEREVALLQHQTSLLKVRANRSEMVAARSGEALTKVRELRAITTERQGVMIVLKVLGDTLPPRTKLDNFTIERDGIVFLDGSAETELDVSTLLERFKRTTLFVNPRLTFIQREDPRDGSDSLFRFRLETLLVQPMLNLPGEDESNVG